MAYVDLEELQGNVYFESATLDRRYKFEEIQPDPSIAEVLAGSGTWMDGLRRFRLVDCAHREDYRDGSLCTFCGHANPYEPPAETAARKTRARKQAPKK